MVQKVFQKWKPHMVVTKGCRVELRDPKSRQLLGKGWKLATTHERLAQAMELPCNCNGPHAPCQGRLTRASAYYTDQFARRVCRVLLQGAEWSALTEELEGSRRYPNEFVQTPPSCSCAEVQHPRSDMTCHVCMGVGPGQFCGVGSDAQELEPLTSEERERDV